ncbi:oligoendopeptidase F [Mesomycoplasma ovipneumoniae]|uniref:oligoendopeptidase F n=1 Tax=Mesomycoplasma ovipneumoniae TaxID=29562 RepID=UPI0028AD24FF|nr:oligoendopeptidase F [Mesomycoplasma ovipneumoniae]MDW2907357.1 oligoendopeptidase F [Mesomycoplasma ovipneumoniae]MDW2910545.1 oligoendopeptidase F [Mesomycoplasma ovipneumoniae]MDW2911594.1 oligoendopeptidase F [Mesomycoplasma ovipneumoniae]MDW2913689.1 oligoendopeptidase F [Mesomycoplasma ovipneumoniae]MDW2917981.1 oligoendopeptidase F [Mesomycoplasma ovipneumoniae]
MQFKKYSEIPEKHRFDLEVLLEGKTIEENFAEIVQISQKLIQAKDQQFDNVENFLHFKKLEEDFGIKYNKIYNYISNNISTNVVSPVFSQLNEKFFFLMSEFEAKLGSLDVIFYKNEEKIRSWINDERVKPYLKDLNYRLDNKKHKLDDQVEEYLTKTSFGEVSVYKIFSILSNSETKFADIIDEKGDKLPLNSTNYFNYLKTGSPHVRQLAYQNYYSAYLEHKNTFANLFYQHIKSASVDAKTRNYPSLIQACLSSDRFLEDNLQNLFSNVAVAFPIFDKFFHAQKQFYKAKFGTKMNHWDRLVPLVEIKDNYSVEDAQEIVLKSIEPMGEEYVEIVKKSFSDRWIDYHYVPSKRSGAYSIGGSYGLEKKYILMNFDFTINSVHTLAHELGHSLHSYYSDLHQDYHNSSYPIFLAEIASIFNELMVDDYLLKNQDDDKLKFDIVFQKISTFISTVQRQVIWADYEATLYKKMDSGELTGSYDDFVKIYEQIIKKYKPNDDEIDEKSFIYSVIVPHYYYGYYVYKYAIGYLAANVFFQKYKKEGKTAIKNYIENFLSKGGSDWPSEILKNAGVDLSDPEMYRQAFSVLESQIDEYIRLGKKIFNIDF